tara:strand:+ start:1 stop:834 length:834 start_codon:yes stop_codon:yes gene_type:complete
MYFQYISFLKNLVLFDLGVSIRTKQPVILELANRFSATFELVFFSMILAFIIGFPLGLLAALKSNTLLDTFIRGIGYIGLAIPIFWLGMMMQLIFFGTLQWFPLQGRYAGISSLDSQLIHTKGFLLFNSFLSGEWSLFFDGLWHIILPACTMALGVLGIILRTTRSAMVDSMNEPFFQTYVSYGFNNVETIRFSAYKNTLIPVSTVAGLTFGLMLGGTFLVESIFDWPGLGQFSVLSILTNDFPAVIGVTILYTITYVIVNFSIDIFYGFIDPRIKK